MLTMSSVIASAKFLDRKAEGGGGEGGVGGKTSGDRLRAVTCHLGLPEQNSRIGLGTVPVPVPKFQLVLAEL